MKKKKKTLKIGKPVQFYKFEATGNDFILIDERGALRIKASQRRSFVKKYCDRKFGLGADGVIFIEKPSSSAATVRWDFFNSDGSKAEMCGNAARVVGLFETHFRNRRNVRLQTVNGIVGIQNLRNGLYEITMPAVNLSAGPRSLRIEGREWKFYLINSGVPHAVVPLTHKTAHLNLEKVAVGMKRSKLLGPKGANVTFVLMEKNDINAVTHERGVEDFTLSCGTGAVAAGWYISKIDRRRWSGKVKVPGGDLKVKFKERPHLIGPAKFVAEGLVYV